MPIAVPVGHAAAVEAGVLRQRKSRHGRSSSAPESGSGIHALSDDARHVAASMRMLSAMSAQRRSSAVAMIIASCAVDPSLLPRRALLSACSV